MVQNHGGMQMEPMYLSIRPVETGKRIKAASFRAELYDPRIKAPSALRTHRQSTNGLPENPLPSLDNFIILSRLLHTSIENILVIDGDIPHLWGGLNQRFNDIFLLPPYNRVIRN